MKIVNVAMIANVVKLEMSAIAQKTALVMIIAIAQKTINVVNLALVVITNRENYANNIKFKAFR